MITAQGLTYRYSKETQITFPDFSYDQGDQVLVLGDSGCGKTTLMHMIAGLLQLQLGTISINGNSIKNLSGAAMDKFRGANIGIIFQAPHFIEALTVNENLQLAQALAGKKKDKIKVQALLDDLGIGHKLNASVKALSQGEKQRVTIARALINEPSIILADEPTSALDDKNCEGVVHLLKEQAKKNNATLLIVTHDNRLTKVFDQKLLLS